MTTAEAKAFARVTTSSDDALIDTLIKSARMAAENELERSLITQTWERTLDEFPDAIRLDYSPIISVSSIQYLDWYGVSQTLSSSGYKVDAKSEPGWVVPAYGYVWPLTLEDINAVTVTYTAGYGASASAVPEPIKTWIKLMVAHYYENREASVPAVTIVPLPFIGGLLDPFRILTVS